jgi:hypothetical protein
MPLPTPLYRVTIVTMSGATKTYENIVTVTTDYMGAHLTNLYGVTITVDDIHTIDTEVQTQ